MKILAILAIFLGLVKSLSCLAKGTNISLEEKVDFLTPEQVNKIGNGVIILDALIEIFCGIFILMLL